MGTWSRLLTAFKAGQDGHETARGERLRDAFETDVDAFLNLTTKLRRSDLHLIGTVVQLYSYADFNARRIVAALDYAAAESPREPSRLGDGKVFPTLGALASQHLPDGKWRDGILVAQRTFEMHRDHRHDFAHWATRRIKGADALVIFTMNANAAEKRSGVPLPAQEARYGIVTLPGLRTEVRKLAGHTNYLAAAAAHIDTHIAELRDRIKERRGQAGAGQGGQE